MEIISRHPKVNKKMALNVVCLKKYTMPYSTFFWSIYTNSVCSLMENTEILILRESKKILILSRHPNVKNKIALNIICQKNIQCPILLCFGVYTPTQYALSCKIPKFLFVANRKKPK